MLETFRFGPAVAGRERGSMAIYNEAGVRVADIVGGGYREVDSDGNEVPNGRIFLYTPAELGDDLNVVAP